MVKRSIASHQHSTFVMASPSPSATATGEGSAPSASKEPAPKTTTAEATVPADISASSVPAGAGAGAGAGVGAGAVVRKNHGDDAGWLTPNGNKHQRVPSSVAIKLRGPLVWVDLEMTGLELSKHTIVEIAVIGATTVVALRPAFCLKCSHTNKLLRLSLSELPVTDGDLSVAYDGPDIVIHHDEVRMVQLLRQQHAQLTMRPAHMCCGPDPFLFG